MEILVIYAIMRGLHLREIDYRIEMKSSLEEVLSELKQINQCPDSTRLEFEINKRHLTLKWRFEYSSLLIKKKVISKV